MKREFEKRNTGITLIALVVSIIIILILAGISINMLSGNNSILNKAIEAREDTIIAQEKEAISLVWNSLIADNITKGTTITDKLLEDELKRNGNNVSVSYDDENNFAIHFIDTDHTYTMDNEQKTNNIKVGIAVNKNTKYIDNNGNTAIIPKGFAVSGFEDEQTINKGLVIYEIGNDNVVWNNSNKLDIQKNYNQFVWIPVNQNIKFSTEFKNETDIESGKIILSRYQFKNANNDGKENTNDEDRPRIIEETNKIKMTINASCYAYEDNNNSVALNINNFIEEANSNYGYYIGRYEASNSNGVVCKKDKGVYSNISRNQAKELSQNMYNTDDFSTDLINSYAWDTAIIFIEKCGINSLNYAYSAGTANTKLNTGGSNDIQCNIYDIAGNVGEFTTEYCQGSSVAITRGDDYNKEWCTCGRYWITPSEQFDRIGFRMILYFSNKTF